MAPRINRSRFSVGAVSPGPSGAASSRDASFRNQTSDPSTPIRPRSRTPGYRSAVLPASETETQVRADEQGCRPRLQVSRRLLDVPVSPNLRGCPRDGRTGRARQLRISRLPPWKPRISICRVADERKIVRNRRGRHAEFFDDTSLVTNRRGVRRFNCTTLVPRTHCARSLSGVQMITSSTRSSESAAAAAAANASSASVRPSARPSRPLSARASSRSGN